MFKISIRYKIGKINEQLLSYRVHENNAIGFSIISKNNKIKIENIQKAVTRLDLFSKQKDVSRYSRYFYILNRYYNIKLKFIKDNKTNLIRYLLISFELLYYFPRLYKHVLKNITEDTMPKLHMILIKTWLNRRMKI